MAAYLAILIVTCQSAQLTIFHPKDVETKIFMKFCKSPDPSYEWSTKISIDTKINVLKSVRLKIGVSFEFLVALNFFAPICLPFVVSDPQNVHRSISISSQESKDSENGSRSWSLSSLFHRFDRSTSSVAREAKRIGNSFHLGNPRHSTFRYFTFSFDEHLLNGELLVKFKFHLSKRNMNYVNSWRFRFAPVCPQSLSEILQAPAAEYTNIEDEEWMASETFSSDGIRCLILKFSLNGNHDPFINKKNILGGEIFLLPLYSDVIARARATREKCSICFHGREECIPIPCEIIWNSDTLTMLAAHQQSDISIDGILWLNDDSDFENFKLLASGDRPTSLLDLSSSKTISYMRFVDYLLLKNDLLSAEIVAYIFDQMDFSKVVEFLEQADATFGRFREAARERVKRHCQKKWIARLVNRSIKLPSNWEERLTRNININQSIEMQNRVE